MHDRVQYGCPVAMKSLTCKKFPPCSADALIGRPPRFIWFSSVDNGAGAKTDKFALGYVHDLSKRTALYGTFASLSNSGGAAQALNGAATPANGSSTGFDIGVRHAF